MLLEIFQKMLPIAAALGCYKGPICIGRPKEIIQPVPAFDYAPVHPWRNDCSDWTVINAAHAEEAVFTENDLVVLLPYVFSMAVFDTNPTAAAVAVRLKRPAELLSPIIGFKIVKDACKQAPASVYRHKRPYASHKLARMLQGLFLRPVDYLQIEGALIAENPVAGHDIEKIMDNLVAFVFKYSNKVF
jgi:hypothetical protein